MNPNAFYKQRIRYLVFAAFLIIGNNAFAITPIDTTEFILVGGIKQYVSIKGKDRSKPLLLFLHGGPGGSVMSYADKFTLRLQQKFVVVQWDQRETGKTLKLNPSPVPLTLSLFQQDTHDLVVSLLHQFKQQKIYLLGHSWGTILGFYMAKHYPELLHAYVAISPMINQLESERIILTKMKQNAQKTGDHLQQEELSTIKVPFENGEQLYFHRKWLFVFNGQKTTLKTFSKNFALNWSATWLQVWNEASAINLNESLPVLNCPVYFCIGRKDYQTNYRLTEVYYEKLKAPKKQLFWFDNTGHSIPTAKPNLLQDIIINKILPETYKRSHH
jgi:pimeloyl-ACP methyl ester carboxylesterase